jgi:hypothetical protein
MSRLLYFKYKNDNLDGYPLMQRFTLLHDGSDQGWQAAYLAFHIAAQLGAPLFALLVGSASDEKILARNASQVEVGGRAAGLVIKTRLVTEFSVDIVEENVADSDGLFVPRRLIPDEETAARFLEASSCPLWIVSKEAEMHKMAVLVDDLAADKALITFTATLSNRLQQSLTGLVRKDEIALTSDTDESISWLPLEDFSPAEINATLNQLGAGLLFLPLSRLSLVHELSLNCVIYPAMQDA